MENSAIISRRKALKKAAAARLGILVERLEWLNGQLCLVENHKPVEGVEKVSKPLPNWLR